MKNIEKLLVLVPHNDARTQLLKYSESLYKNVLKGMYMFPCVIPIASISGPLNPDELKQTAHQFRKSIGKEKIYFSEIISASINICGRDMVLFGHRLEPEINLSLSEINTNKINFFFTPILSGIYFIPKNNNKHENETLKQCAQLSNPNLQVRRFAQCVFFSAAAVANMFWKPCRNLRLGNREKISFSESSFETENKTLYYKWKIEKLFWLPKK